jgi:hypothetical protein
MITSTDGDGHDLTTTLLISRQWQSGLPGVPPRDFNPGRMPLIRRLGNTIFYMLATGY